MRHAVIFSHGFGTRRDDRGLFSDIVAALENIEPVMFDYNIINEAENTITVRTLREQANILKKEIENAKQSNPDGVIDLVCHSQGSIIAALLKPTGIRKTIFIAPPMKTDIDRKIERFKSRPGSEINIDGISKLARLDGSTTIVPSQYLKEIAGVNLKDLYKDFSNITELTIIIAKQDEVVGSFNFSKSGIKAKVIEVDGNHNFSGDARKSLASAVKNILP